jgi:hypothetical protein
MAPSKCQDALFHFGQAQIYILKFIVHTAQRMENFETTTNRTKIYRLLDNAQLNIYIYN